MVFSRRTSFAAVLGLTLFGTACGGASSSSGPADNAEASATTGEPEQAAASSKDGMDIATLDALRQKLAAGKLGVSKLDVAGKGWGPELGQVLGSSPSLAGIATLDVSD